MFAHFLVLFLSAAPTLVGRVVDSRGSPIVGVAVRVVLQAGTPVDVFTDNGGAFRLQVGTGFQLEFRRPGYRTVQTLPLSIPPAASDGIYQIEISLLPGNPSDIEIVEMTLSDVHSIQDRGEPSVNEALPKSDRLFGLRGGVNVTGIAEGSGQQWVAASGSVFTSSSMTVVGETSDFSAELGDYDGPDDALSAGGDAFHGNLYYFHRNDKLNARNFFDPPGSPIPPFKYHFFGGDAGGRLREGAYFHFQYWALRIRQSITRAATVPDPQWLQGDFSSLSDPVIDPESGFPFEGNRIPASRLNPQGLAWARLYPAPNVAGTSIQNYRAVGKLETAADSFGVRLDHRWSRADEIFLEYQFSRDTTSDPFNLLSGITNLPSFGVRDALETHGLRVNNSHVFSPAIVHQLRFSTSYLQQPRTLLDDPAQPPMAAVLITGLSNLGHAANLPQQRRNRSFELLSDLSWQQRSSVTKLGGSFRYFPFQASLDLYSRGQHQFTGGVLTGNALANLLLGLPANSLRIEGSTARRFTTWTSSVYVQHDMRLNATLLANLGLRYDYQSPFRETNGLAANFNPVEGKLERTIHGLYHPDRNNLGPRVGLVWQPHTGYLVRIGYGVFYDTLAVGDSLFLLGLNPPFVKFDVENNGRVVPLFDLNSVFQNSLGAAPPSIFSTSKELPNPYIQQWSVIAEKLLAPDLTLELSYFGQKGARLRRQLNLNQPSPGADIFIDARRPFPGFRNIFQFETSASSIAHAAEVRSVRRFRSGLGFIGAYRFSRSIDDATLISVLPQNSHDLRSERALSDFHVKHRVVFSAAYNLPSRSFLRGWQVQAVGTVQSGSPLSAVLGTDVAGTGSPIVNRPDMLRNPNVSSRTAFRFFDPTAFQRPQPGAFGNSGRNVIIGPGVRNVDLALSRSARLTDLTRVQFRVDFYNVLNHPNFVAPPSMQNFFDSPDFGALFVARSPRIVQLGLKFLW